MTYFQVLFLLASWCKTSSQPSGSSEFILLYLFFVPKVIPDNPTSIFPCCWNPISDLYFYVTCSNLWRLCLVWFWLMRVLKPYHGMKIDLTVYKDNTQQQVGALFMSWKQKQPHFLIPYFIYLHVWVWPPTFIKV